MATFNLVFDESGTGADCSHVIYAGFFAQSQLWDEFSRRWRALLNTEGLEYFHATEAFSFGGAWRKFGGHDADKEHRRDELIRSLARLAAWFPKELTATTIDVKAFKALPIQKREPYYDDPFYCAFERGIYGAIRHSDVTPADNFNLICDDSEEHAEICLKVYRRFMKNHPDIAKRLGTICFGDDKKYLPLQLADLVAYCMRRKAMNGPAGLWREIHDYFFSIAAGDISQSDVII